VIERHPGALAGATGVHSVYKKWKHLEIMYEVAPLMIGTDPHRRKALIGNTIVTIVFQDSGRFDPGELVSQVLHVFVVVQPVRKPDGTTLYKYELRLSSTAAIT
jgi:hypothetical protein